jgi:CRP/FNR family transcriptional regulator, cyclic AMP receptor protein
MGTPQMSAEHLTRISLFRDLPADALDRLAGSCTLAERAKGEFLYDAGGNAPDCVFGIVEGEIEVWLESSGAEPVLLGSIGASGLAGEFAAIAGRGDSCVLRARTETRLIVLPREVFLELLEAHPGLAVALLRDMIGVIRLLNARVASLKGAHGEFDRIQHELLRFVI